jgi:hypothetical protein
VAPKSKRQNVPCIDRLAAIDLRFQQDRDGHNYCSCHGSGDEAFHGCKGGRCNRDCTCCGSSPGPSTFVQLLTASQFVRVHQQLLNVIIGKNGILAKFFFTRPIALVLREIEGVVDVGVISTLVYIIFANNSLYPFRRSPLRLSILFPAAQRIVKHRKLRLMEHSKKPSRHSLEAGRNAEIAGEHGRKRRPQKEA